MVRTRRNLEIDAHRRSDNCACDASTCRHKQSKRSSLTTLVVVTLLLSWTARAFADEYTLKAAWLLQFGKLFKWPNEGNANPPADFHIGVLGNNPFSNNLMTRMRRIRILNRRVVVTHISDTRNHDFSSYQILFVKGASRQEIRRVNNQTMNRPRNKVPVLIVSDTPGTANGAISNSAAISFRIRDNRIRLEINTSVLTRSRIVKRPNQSAVWRGLPNVDYVRAPAQKKKTAPKKTQPKKAQKKNSNES